jgi:phage/plasmid-associated DNA primase
MKVSLANGDVPEPKLQYKIIEKLNKKFKLVSLKESRQIMVFEDNHFTLDLTSLERFISSEIKGANENLQFYTKEVYEWIRMNLQLHMRGLNFDVDFIPFLNGYYLVSEKKFYPCMKFDNFNFFYSIPHKYRNHREYDCPMFKKLLVQWIDGKCFEYNPQTKRNDIRIKGYRKGKRRLLINDVFEMIGLCMSLEMGFKAVFINYGEKDTGKTQFANIISFIIGDDNMSDQELSVLTERFGSTAIQFKILNYCADMTNTAIKKTGMFNLYTGGDRNIPAEIKGGGKFKFPPTAKFWFNINLFPYIKDFENNAFFGRFILNHFPNIFSKLDNEFQINYGDLIINNEDEIQGIIHEALAGLHRLYDRKGFREELKEETKHIWNYKSNPYYRFICDMCVENRKKMIEQHEFWDIFYDIIGAGLGKSQITQGLGKLGYMVREKKISLGKNRRKSVYYYAGLEWKDKDKVKELIAHFNEDDEIESKNKGLDVF